MNLLFAVLLQAAQVVNPADTASATAPGAATGEEGLSLFTLLVKGGWVMIPILLLSLLAVYLFIERYLYIRKASYVDPSFLSNVREQLYREDVKGALRYASSAPFPVARLIEKGLSRMGSPIRDIESVIENMGRVEVAKMEKNLGLLSAVAAIAPMFGFLGTVIGMIKAFYDISQTANISIDVISEGIYTKMVTSAAGLIVGVMAHMFYTYLNNMIDRVVHRMEVTAIDFLDILYKPAA